MFNADTHELLCLFTAMVLADKKIYAVEIDEFCDVVIDFHKQIDSDVIPSQARLLMWFEINHDNIRQKLCQSDFEPWFRNLMARMTKIYPSYAIVKALKKIAQADNEVHISEKALLVLVDRYWSIAA